jgi:hypothetical protein
MLSDLIEAQWSHETPSFALARRARGKKGLGLKYEHKAQGFLETLFEGSYIPSPWFRYRVAAAPARWNWAQPDGIALNPNEGIVYVMEIKLKHTPEAFFQLLDKYIPILTCWLGTSPGWRFAPIEVCYWYDPKIAFPTRVVLQEDPRKARPHQFSVNICRP